MTPCPTARNHDCTVPLACLRSAVAVHVRADERYAEQRAAQMFVIWPDSAAWCAGDLEAAA